MKVMQARRGSSDTGAAMVLVMIWSTVLLIMSAVIAQAVLNQIRPSERTERSYQAWAAAEAGIDDYRARLAANGQYFKTADPTNLAFTSWVDVPGGESIGEFTYTVDTSLAARTGRIRVTSTGRAGTGADQVVRTVEAVIAKRSSADYSYFSNFETWPADYPGAYTGKQGMLTPEQAAVLCANRYWYTSGPVLPDGTQGTHRNSLKCLHDAIQSTEIWSGSLHTNDVWYMMPTIANIDPAVDPPVTGQVFRGLITSSCPDPTATSTGCPEGHRWIDQAYLDANSNQSYLATEIIDNNPKLWNPGYESVLEMPGATQVATLRQLAVTSGCLYTGVTRIRFYTVNGRGKIAVTSPDTKSTNAFCQQGTTLTGTTHATTPTTAQNHPTAILDYDTMVAAGFNGVIYVQDVPASSSDPNYWSVTPPTCEIKLGTNPFPYVIPDPTIATYNDADLYSGSMTNRGFPIESANYTGSQIDDWSTPWTTRCKRGTAYVQGAYTGQYTLMADGDTAITGDLIDATVTNRTYTSPPAADYGMPAADSTNLMGLVPRSYLYVFHPTSEKSGGNSWIAATMQDLIVNIAILSREGCFAIQEYKSTPTMGNLTMVGSIGQDYRCKITNTASNAGYQDLVVKYDERFKELSPPPYMQELSQEPWRVQSMSETSIRRDVDARQGVAAVTASQARSTTAQYDVLAGAPAGSTLDFARITSGFGSITTTGGKVQFTAPNGIATTYAEFVITKPGGMRVAQSMVLSTS